VFVGRRKEPFQVNLGEIFDLVDIPVGTVVGRPDGAQSTTDDKNITTLGLQVPISCLTNGSDPVIGGWTTASLRQGRLLNPAPGSNTTSASLEGGPWDGYRRVQGHALGRGEGCRTAACVGMRGEGAALADAGIFDAALAGAIFTNVANAG
jgi:hypothetical protein